jgi:hypothetical protein
MTMDRSAFAITGNQIGRADRFVVGLTRRFRPSAHTRPRRAPIWTRPVLSLPTSFDPPPRRVRIAARGWRPPRLGSIGSADQLIGEGDRDTESAEACSEPRVAEGEAGCVVFIERSAARTPREVGVVQWEVVACHARVRVGRNVVGVLPVTDFRILGNRSQRIRISQGVLVRLATKRDDVTAEVAEAVVRAAVLDHVGGAPKAPCVCALIEAVADARELDDRLRRELSQSVLQ